MQLPNLVLGYSEFDPEKTALIYGDEERSLQGNRTIIRREEADIVWVRVTGAATYLSFKGRVVKRLSSYNDFYGLASSARRLMEEAPRAAAGWKIDRDSELELHAVGWIEDTPTLGFEQTDYGRRYYKPLPSHIWYDHPDAKQGEVMNSQNFPYDSARRIDAISHSATIIWNSALSDEQNAAAFSAFDALVRASERVVTDTGVHIPD
jgi:hypothetical protein|nr:hypothetical protein [Neorhizobium tomejilense]